MSNTQIGPFGLRRNPNLAVGPPPPPPRNSNTSSVRSAIFKAIELGYRHIRVAIDPSPEDIQAMQDAIDQAMNRGLIKSKKDLFISCMIQYSNDTTAATIVQDLKTFIESQQLTFVDMFLIEWPGEDESKQVSNGDTNVVDIAPLWKAMEQCYKIGLTKSIGACNFSSGMLQRVLDFAEIRPAANQASDHTYYTFFRVCSPHFFEKITRFQVGMQVFLREKELRQFCMDKKISMIVTSTIGATQGQLDYADLMATVKGMEKIAKDEQEGTTELEVVHRWVYEQGAGLWLESFSEEHMQELLNILH